MIRMGFSLARSLALILGMSVHIMRKGVHTIKGMSLAPVVLTVVMTVVRAQAEGIGLDLNAYLKEVQDKHLGVKASETVSDAAMERSKEGDLVFTPSLFGEVNWSNEKYAPTTDAFFGTEGERTNYTLGVQTQTKFGLSAKLSYLLTESKDSGVSPLINPEPNVTTAKPRLELSFPLWRNWLGEEWKSQAEQTNSAALQLAFLNRYEKLQVLVAAEVAYWRLSLAREQVRIQRENLERSQRILQWNQRRARLELSDKSDLLQANAAFRLRELELQTALNEERQAARQFNSLRGIDLDAVTETLVLPNSEQLLNLSSPSAAGLRDDIRAAEQQARLSEASAKAGIERQKPQVEVFGQYGLNGKDGDFGGALSEAHKFDYDYRAIGVRFSTPLDFGLLKKNREAYRKEANAAQDHFIRKTFEAKIDWNELIRSFEEAKSRLTLAREIEKVQEDKMLHERRRLQTGRTTTYQALLFEQDFAASQLTRVMLELEVLRLNSQFRLYSDSQTDGGRP